MRRIESQIDTNAPDFKANHAAMSARLKEFHARQHATRFERPQRDIDRLARQNKLGVRERLKLRDHQCHISRGARGVGRLAPRITSQGRLPGACV